MATRILLNVAGPEGEGKPQVYLVKESFEQVIERIIPTQPPTSQLESRANRLYTTVEGKPLFLDGGYMVSIEGDVDEDG